MSAIAAGIVAAVQRGRQTFEDAKKDGNISGGEIFDIVANSVAAGFAAYGNVKAGRPPDLPTPSATEGFSRDGDYGFGAATYAPTEYTEADSYEVARDVALPTYGQEATGYDRPETSSPPPPAPDRVAVQRDEGGVIADIPRGRPPATFGLPGQVLRAYDPTREDDEDGGRAIPTWRVPDATTGIEGVER
ncbi:hypothetical protein [Jannaschia sp. LMIT008]|uniref:hypothetical protein n=1 Tax=Jannaschia maritima TaxID=3032585 RepID=UPI0028121B9B|nr:hypothetical protein [Jannaschia sp. LMIT008]